MVNPVTYSFSSGAEILRTYFFFFYWALLHCWNRFFLKIRSDQLAGVIGGRWKARLSLYFCNKYRYLNCSLVDWQYFSFAISYRSLLILHILDKKKKQKQNNTGIFLFLKCVQSLFDWFVFWGWGVGVELVFGSCSCWGFTLTWSDFTSVVRRISATRSVH